MWLKASYTIEAAFVMPMVLGVIILLMYMSFFLHDNVVINECAFTVVAKYADERELSNSAIEGKLLNYNSDINKRLIASEITYMDADVSKSKIKLEVKGKFKFPSLKIVNNLINNKSESIGALVEVKRIQPVKFIRNVRKIQSIID